VKSSCCGAPCNGAGNPNEPCYGECDVIDEVETVDSEGDPDYMWVHGCEGHQNWPGPYVPQVTP